MPLHVVAKPTGATQPRKSPVPFPEQGPAGDAHIALFPLAMHLPLGHWASALQ
jgi:hypothetical protein